jgi:ABC-type glutathione transport system ATPase component
VWFGWLGSKRQPHEQQLNSSTSTKAALQPLQKASQGDKLLLQPLSGSPDTDDDADSVSGEYVINPRLTLVFRDVWVADRPIDEGLLRKAQRRLQGLCCSSASSYDASTSHTSHWASGDASRVCELSGHSLSTTKQADIFTKLETAAAAGAHFIVPGVSSRFAHSQLHAIMGPSGCGKTTLCKALAGRLPQSRMCGDVRLLCSSAADGYKAEVELTAAGSQGSAAAAFNISNMTGFVPQFDQLHETLTVSDADELRPC